MYLFSVFKHCACQSSEFQPNKLYISEIGNQYSIYYAYKKSIFENLKIGLECLRIELDARLDVTTFCNNV